MVADFQETYSVDLHHLVATCQWHRLVDLLMGLRSWSRTWAALINDEETARDIARAQTQSNLADDSPTTISLSDLTPTVQAVYTLSTLVARGLGFKKWEPPRVESRVAEIEQEIALQRAQDLIARVTPHAV